MKRRGVYLVGHNCNKPICSPKCLNGGHCVEPNKCDCPSTSQGQGCSQVTCSYQNPCFPGECQEDQSCRCDPGFSSPRRSDGCIQMTDSGLKPLITKSMVTLSNIRQTDGKKKFEFILDGTSRTKTETLWSNQKEFNTLDFEFESLFTPPDQMQKRPFYVHDAGMGIAEGSIEVKVTKVSKHGSARHVALDVPYNCSFSPDAPKPNKAVCKLKRKFDTRIDHGDQMTVKFRVGSGGFQELWNTDSSPPEKYDTKHYDGLETTTQVEFKFDFHPPKLCSKNISVRICSSSIDGPMALHEEFLKNSPLVVHLGDWLDDMSRLSVYDFEIFKLGPTPALTLVELTPRKPVYSVSVQAGKHFPHYRPTETAMYSVLMTVRDKANNSRTARRLFLYDDTSRIDVIRNSSAASLYVSSANSETGYRWQAIQQDGPVNFVINWTDHFVNRIHSDGKFLNRVERYPKQYEELKDDNILQSKKFVDDALDDHAGQRTVDPIPNYNGIVKFWIHKEKSCTPSSVRKSGWEEISPLAQTSTFEKHMQSGECLRVTVKASDVMDHVEIDSTTVKVDASPPDISTSGSDQLQMNVEDGAYDYTSRVSFSALDENSGVFRLGYRILLHQSNGDTVIQNLTIDANIGEIGNIECRTVENVCYLLRQTIDLDNCLFMVNKKELDTATATVVIFAYNQVMMEANATLEDIRISQLKGLDKYSGPKDVRIEQTTPQGFRVAWYIPEKTSCYGLADVVIAIYEQDADGITEVQRHIVSGSKTFFDVLGLQPATDYNVTFGIQSRLGPIQDTGNSLVVKTSTAEQGVGVDTIIGIVVGLSALFASALVVFVVLVRRGVIHPRERAASMRRAVSRKYRQTVYGDVGETGQSRRKHVSYDNRQSELYIYGEMTHEVPQIWEIARDAIVLETLIKSGSFAEIYKAQLRRQNKSETVVAKTLKANYSYQDELLMRAKMNFAGTVVGDHPNVLKFIGAVTDDTAMGPFIIYEYCENGTLRDYLTSHSNDVTVEMQESLLRFGLQVARGMEYLASKQVVHRRLAARNILLTFLSEVKVAGFGPQPTDELEEDADQNKRERIPIKWMAPECMSSTKDATELSDAWSYGVVLWEIFSLGDTPYGNIRSRDLPSKVKKGYRLSKPEACDGTWYDLMKRCWSYDSAKRPTFAEIVTQLDSLFVAPAGGEYYYVGS